MKFIFNSFKLFIKLIFIATIFFAGMFFGYSIGKKHADKTYQTLANVFQVEQSFHGFLN